MKCVNCPTCEKPVEWTEKAKWRPFCSERCQLIDLGQWADESYTIPGEEHRPLQEQEEDIGLL